MADFIVYAAAGLLSGLLGSLGVGGGGILIVILTVFMNFSGISAAVYNLIFFLPIALFSVTMYARDNKINYRATSFISVFGTLGAVGGVLLAKFIGGNTVSDIFAVILIAVSVSEWFKKDEIS